MDLHIALNLSKNTLLSNIQNRQDCYPTVTGIPVASASQVTTRITQQLAKIPKEGRT